MQKKKSTNLNSEMQMNSYQIEIQYLSKEMRNQIMWSDQNGISTNNNNRIQFLIGFVYAILYGLVLWLLLFLSFSLSLSHFWCHFEYSWTFIFILCSIHLQTNRDLFLFSIHRCYMSISQEFIAPLWVRVRKVAELIKCFFMVRYSAMFLFSFYFWFAT